MKQRIAALLICTLFLAGCTAPSPAPAPEVKLPAQTPQDTPRPEEEDDPSAGQGEETQSEADALSARADEIVSAMTAEEKAGALFIVPISGTALSEKERARMERCHFTNVILFARNIGTREEVRALTGQIRAFSEQRSGLPAIIGIDQEGGTVTRLDGVGSSFPPAMAMAAGNDADAVRRAGEITGEELAWFGINMDFAPDADLNTNPANPVIGVRSFGDDPDAAADMICAFAQGLQEGGVLATVKHFPGHGDTQTDSHKGLPVVEKTLDQLAACELIPFRRAIEAGVDAVMTTHILFPKIEADGVPATMSDAILTGLLRETLGFDGMIVTDSMEMAAIAEHYGVEAGTVAAVRAGADLIIAPSDAAKQESAYEAVLQAVRTGEISGERLDAAARSVVLARLRIAARESAVRTPDFAANAEEAVRCAVRSATLLSGDWRAPSGRVLVLSPEGKRVSVSGGGSFGAACAQRLAFDQMTVDSSPTQAQIDSAVQKAGRYDAVLIAATGSGCAKLAAAVGQKNAAVSVFLFGSPYAAARYAGAASVVCFYDYSSTTVEGAVRMLEEGGAPSGTLPVSPA